LLIGGEHVDFSQQIPHIFSVQQFTTRTHSFWKGFVRLIGANSEIKKPPASLLGLQTVLIAAGSALSFSL